MSDNTDLKTFFNPHSGHKCAAIPIPEAVKKIAEELNGKHMSCNEAVKKIQAVASENETVSVKNGWIALTIHEPNGTIHMFRVICFN